MTTTKENAQLGRPGAKCFFESTPCNYKRFPAFGKQFNQMRQRGEIPSLLPVFVVYDWELAKSFARIVIDPAIAPSGYQFNFLAGLPVQICAEEGDMPFVGELVRELIKAAPSEITLLRFADVATETPACTVLYSQNRLQGEEAA